VPQSTLSQIYFKEGYAIAAGYGYVLGNSPKGDAVLDEIYRSVTFDKRTALPGSAEPLSIDDIRAELLHPPGMPILVAAVHRTFDTTADLPIQLIGVALDIVSAGIVWWTLRFVFGARLALLAGLLYAIFPPFAYYAVAKEPDGMVTFFVAGTLACTLKATTKDNWHALLWNIIGGVCIGLGGYLRPDYLLVAVVMLFGLWAYTRRFWHSLFAVGVMQLVAVLLLTPWAYRNYNICGRLIFTSTSVGGTLITGLGEFDNPWGFGGTDEDRMRQATAQGISSPWDCEGDLYFQGLFFKSIQEHPGAYLMSIVKRLPLVLATPYGFGFQNPWKTQTFTEARESGADRYQVLLRQPWYVLAAYWDYLAMSGFALLCFMATLVMTVKERDKAGIILLLISPYLYSVGTHILTHMEPRFLLPSMFCLMPGLAYVLSGLSSDLLLDPDPAVHYRGVPRNT
jgi:4-amino-4-deoxy-L-arabinose transferase-like glycosyltransferase